MEAPILLPNEEDKHSIVVMIDQSIQFAQEHGLVHAQINFEHALNEMPVAHILDYLERRSARVVSMFTYPRWNVSRVMREIVFRIDSGERPPWDGSYEVDGD